MNIEWKRRYHNDLLDRFVNDTMFRIYIAAAIITTLALLYGIYSIITYRKYVAVTVQSVQWDTSYTIYEYQTNHKSDWSVPYDGRETNSYLRQYTTRKVFDHNEQIKHTVPGKCEYVGKGNARQRICISDKVFYTSEPVYRNEPVYRRYYEYDIDEWNRIQPLTASGNSHNWYMPNTIDYKWYTNGNIHIGDRKLGGPSTHFYIIFSGDKQYSIDMVESMWKTYDINDKADLTISFVGSILEVKKKNTW